VHLGAFEHGGHGATRHRTRWPLHGVKVPVQNLLNAKRLCMRHTLHRLAKVLERKSGEQVMQQLWLAYTVLYRLDNDRKVKWI
jgi:hypothetical protein